MKLMMPEDEMYELATRVQTKCCSPPTLKLLCLDFTIKKWKSYTDLNEKLKINAFENMGAYFKKKHQ